jgi:signal recognition particle receptor subunit beta
MANSDKASPESIMVVKATPLFQTTVRLKITPYLPPPVVMAMKRLDPQLEPYVGPEGSINIFGTLLVAWLFFRVIRLVTAVVGVGGGGGGGKAIREEIHDHDILPPDATNRRFDKTILLCGPSLAGKTSIFYRMIYENAVKSNGNTNIRDLSINTVRSIKSNTGFLEMPNGNTWRILDTPGHWGPQKLIQAIPVGQVDQTVLVVDSTQPIASAADYLYAHIMATATTTDAKGSHSGGRNLLIVCHKSDHPKAKNSRRIKLQLRSELERLSHLRTDDPKVVWDEILKEVAINDSSELLKMLQR